MLCSHAGVLFLEFTLCVQYVPDPEQCGELTNRCCLSSHKTEKARRKQAHVALNNTRWR